MKETIRLGLIGCGSIASKRHLPGLVNLRKAGLDNFDVTAVCDGAEANLSAAVAYVGSNLGAEPAAYRTWEELVASGKVDAVDICLPHGLHHVVGVACLEAGIHVLIEKPLAVSLKTGKLLVEAADRTGRLLSAAIPLRRLHGQRTAHWALHEAQLIGTPRTFVHNFAHWRAPVAAARLTDGMRWRRDRVMGGGNTIIDSGTHFIDTLRYLHGDVERVYAEVRAYRDDGPVIAREGIAEHRENTAHVTFTFKSGVVGSWCWTTAAAGAEVYSCVIHGAEGSLEDTKYAESFSVMPFRFGVELRRRDGTHLAMDALQARHRAEIGEEGLQRIFPNGVTDEFALTIWDFLQALETGGKLEIDGHDGLATLATTEAIYESSWSGQAVSVDQLLSGETPSLWQRDIDQYWDEYGMPAPPKVGAVPV